MFKNYLKTAWRNLSKNKSATLINITGLMIGMTCCLLIGLYIHHELSFDKFQKKGDRIARVIMSYRFPGSTESQKGNFTSTKVLPAFQQNFPEVESGVRMMDAVRVISIGDKQFEESRILFADSTIFNVFSFRLLKGNPEHALSGLDKIVLSASTAKRYFGNEDPIGKVVKIGSDAVPIEVTGVIEDCPSNSQIGYDMILSFSTARANQEKTYFNANYTTYLLFKNPEGIASMQAKLPAFMQNETKGMNATINFDLEPFRSIHLHSPYEGFVPNVSIKYIYIIGAVALLILAIACFTYINLSTARSMERAREVGVRKVVGAEKSQIFKQFLSESVLLSLVALILSFGIVLLVLPSFNQLSDRTLSGWALLSPTVIGISLFAIVCIGLLAGSYPAVVLSAFQPVKVLKGAFKSTSSGTILRKTLIVFQFSISAFLIIATFIIQKQLNYIQNRKLGYEREHVVVLPYDRNVLKNIKAIKSEFTANKDILSVSRAGDAPTSIRGGYNMRSQSMAAGQDISVTAGILDEDYIKTVGLQVVAGEDITEQDIKDVDVPEGVTPNYHFVLNESAARTLGWEPQEAIGKNMFLDDSRPGTVKAVVKDFNFQSMHTAIKPLVLFPGKYGRTLLAKISGKNIPQTIAYMESKWKTLVPQRPFNYHFLDEDFNELYKSEIRLGQIINVFAAIAISLACLGLFGLSSYTTQQRIKEIGVRRIVGASVVNIVMLLSKDFMKFVLVSFAVAAPLAWWAMHHWLQDYAYAIKMPLWIFGIAALIVMLITLLTISIQSVRAALANPVKSLRSE
ncbi:FtsX-like permease family protein [Pseudoflavitalea sp. G-6-1-2]|uniref:ABC transporter permease n=1 Tax=Pseudoflavitalea sp. G-6-1-2 TaxID=2728841 RepID=UPI00146AA7DD|nr:ABC transporter permease [Pseudoflavitalea sp. G-6-1-2]NML19554.1 FtsX-like permease family protein [Pseudoflavitalea sp. G-6-1-2]